MNDEEAFLRYLRANPFDLSARLVFADWLEERSDPRGEMLRLQHSLTQEVDQADRSVLEARARELWASGVEAVGPFIEVEIADGVSITLAYIPRGTFMMGSPETEPRRETNEHLHQVTLTQPFYLGVHPVTQEQWQAMMGNNPSLFRGEANLPVEQVSWDESMEYCRKLSERTGRVFTLPTEAQWEYACRAGTSSPFFFGATISSATANYNGNQTYGSRKKGKNRKRTTPAGTFRSNAWGLADMHGNVCQWCFDWYGRAAYEVYECKDPLGSAEGLVRVNRGGSWSSPPRYCRSAFRGGWSPDIGLNYLGFRVLSSASGNYTLHGPE